MKIMHICLADGYTDNSEYQENLLAKYHVKLGYDIIVLSTQFSYKEGIWTDNRETDYYDSNGVYIKRIPFAFNFSYEINKRVGIFKGIKRILDQENPDILFIHNFQFLSILQINKYLKKTKKIVYVDSHVDFSNSGRTWLTKNGLHKCVWMLCANLIKGKVRKFYGVLPARLDFLTDVYKLPKEKCDLLLMGADDEKVKIAKTKASTVKIRNEYGVNDEDFLIVTGGKINEHRPETLNLMDAIAKLSLKNVKLLIFGTVSNSLKTDFEEKCKNSNVIYAGWQKSEDTYRIMGAADLIIFPGLHSVMWEQAVSLGIPCVFKKIDGFSHVDLGGNALFLDDTSINNIEMVIENLANNKEKVQLMKSVAENKGIETFSYKNIAKQSISR
ncbi:MAG: glycosyltransferase family 4 protein [Lachnospiraceae bacterium]|nr:glycosyltransferase family 4 protein [Lachnospiraceae bacterium]